MKHPMELDDNSYFIDDTDLIICDCEREVLQLNLLEEYFEEDDVNKLKREPLEKPPRKQPGPTIALPQKKSDG